MKKFEANKVYLADCADVAVQLHNKVDLVYADILYDEWEDVPYRLLLNTLKPGGAFWLQTDQRSVAEIKVVLDSVCRNFGRLEFINWIIWAYDWGGRSRDRFGKKHDDILWYADRRKRHVFNAKDVQIPKVALINSEKTHKIPTDVWVGNFYTTSQERIKDPTTGKGFEWQKPEWILARIIKACTNKGMLVFEPYMGSGTACAVAKNLGRRFIGCDTSSKAVKLAKTRLAAITFSSERKLK